MWAPPGAGGRPPLRLGGPLALPSGGTWLSRPKSQLLDTPGHRTASGTGSPGAALGLPPVPCAPPRPRTPRPAGPRPRRPRPARQAPPRAGRPRRAQPRRRFPSVPWPPSPRCPRSPAWRARRGASGGSWPSTPAAPSACAASAAVSRRRRPGPWGVGWGSPRAVRPFRGRRAPRCPAPAATTEEGTGLTWTQRLWVSRRPARVAAAAGAVAAPFPAEHQRPWHVGHVGPQSLCLTPSRGRGRRAGVRGPRGGWNAAPLPSPLFSGPAPGPAGSRHIWEVFAPTVSGRLWVSAPVALAGFRCSRA